MCLCVRSEAAAHAVATLAEATLQGGGQIVLAETAAAVGALAGVQDATGTHTCDGEKHDKCVPKKKFGVSFFVRKLKNVSIKC